jgi:hypothetical protein
VGLFLPSWYLIPSASLARSIKSTTKKRPTELKGSYTLRVCRTRASYQPQAALRTGEHCAPWPPRDWPLGSGGNYAQKCIGPRATM